MTELGRFLPVIFQARWALSIGLTEENDRNTRLPLPAAGMRHHRTPAQTTGRYTRSTRPAMRHVEATDASTHSPVPVASSSSPPVMGLVR